MEALIRGMRAPRSLGSVLARVLAPRLVMFGAVAAVLLVGRVMSVDPSSSTLEGVPTTMPTWTAADRSAHPDCVAAADWPEGAPGSAVVVYRFRDASTVRVGFMSAWRANHDASETNDLWVLGVCP